MIAIYSITHKESGKRYIGKTVNTYQRWWSHRNLMGAEVRSKDCNRYLWHAARKYGVDAFHFELLETFPEVNEALMRERELHWMDVYNTCDRRHGYNLRRDSSTRMIVHEETAKLMATVVAGENNPNYGNYWSEQQKATMRDITIARHRSGKYYGPSWRAKISDHNREQWKDEEKKRRMAAKVKVSRHKFNFEQYTRSGEFLHRWDSVEEIVSVNPGWKWQNIYSVCNGYKPTYQGFIWKKVLKNSR